MNTLLHLLVVLAAVAGSAFYAGMETGIVSINRLRLRHMLRKRMKNAEILQEFLQQPDHLLGTTLVGTNLCHSVGTVAAVSLGAHLLGVPGYWTMHVLITLLLLVFGEYLPKAWFQGMPARRAAPFAKALKWSGYILYPASRLITLITRLLMPVKTSQEDTGRPFVTMEELRHLAAEGQKTGTLTTDEGRMIHGVFDLTHHTTRELMVPAAEMIVVRTDTPRDEILRVAREKSVSRLPVFDDSTRRFNGIVYIFDVLQDTEDDLKTARDYMRPPQFVSADTSADELVPRMRLTRQPLMLVIDAAAEVVGLVTVEDVLAKIVGEM